ncbi:hypothetical protein [Halovenus halobia]|uniref:hypothetical protein n=1 Tax=Halovenus halobia TaxID=3396622 RepID=UPI003F561ACB
MSGFPTPRRTPEFGALLFPTTILALLLAPVVLKGGWMPPAAGFLTFAGGLTLGALYTLVDYFTPVLDMVPVANERLRSVSLICHMMAVELLKSRVAARIAYPFLVGLLIAVSVSRGWLFARRGNVTDDV